MIVYRFSPAACPVAKAICRLKPPVYASTSRISPAKYKPGINLDCIVFGSISCLSKETYVGIEFIDGSIGFEPRIVFSGTLSSY